MKLFALVLALCLVSGSARAHGLDTAYVTVTLDGTRARVELRVAAVGMASAERVRIEGCERGPIERSDAPGWTTLRWELSCAEPPSRIEVAPGLHFVKVRDGSGNVIERALDGGSIEIAARRGFGGWVMLGMRHILSGADHLVFLLVLLAGAAGLRALAFVVTGFTLGHSVTLALAALGHVKPDVGAVEALIGLSIAIVAVENAWLASSKKPWAPLAVVGAIAAVALASGSFPFALGGMAIFAGSYFGLLKEMQRPERLRVVVAALFGLVHGFGFAGALPRPDVPALFGFNLGVELAQLALVALAWPLLAWLRKNRERWLVVGTALALAAGTFWFVERSFG